MKTAICTLFEKHYHYGVGALANSLYLQGFRGNVYAGYRGPLPPWATGATRQGLNRRLEIAPGMAVVFVPLETQHHFTNYKAQFMLDLMATECRDAEALYYFDPDITVKARWPFFEGWVKAGVAVCEDVNAAMGSNHPMRYAWKQFLAQHGMTVVREPDAYYNGGFVGVRADQLGFLRSWREILETLAPEVGGLTQMFALDRTYPFNIPDQESLNMATMVAIDDISPVGPDGMDFQAGGGGYIMCHAVGGMKPWRRRYVVEVLTQGIPPSRADRNFWRNVSEPICLYGRISRWWHEVDLQIGVLLGRLF